MSLSKETRIYLALWRRALLSGEPISIKTQNLSMALTHQKGLYRAIKPYRIGKSFDPELTEAAEKFVISVERVGDSKAPHTVVFRERRTLTDLEREMEALGISNHELLTAEERDLQKKVDAIMPTASRSTPFYTRGE